MGGRNFLHSVDSGSSVTILFLKTRFIIKAERSVHVIVCVVIFETTPKRTSGPHWEVDGGQRRSSIRKKVVWSVLIEEIDGRGYAAPEFSWKWEKSTFLKMCFYCFIFPGGRHMYNYDVICWILQSIIIIIYFVKLCFLLFYFSRR